MRASARARSGVDKLRRAGACYYSGMKAKTINVRISKKAYDALSKKAKAERRTIRAVIDLLAKV